MSKPTPAAVDPDDAPIHQTGIGGLDSILGGGLVAGRLYLLEGMPGSGKTTLALQFLLAGVACNEAVLYITLSETAAELRGVARSHGWDLSGIDVRELPPSEDAFVLEEQATMFHPSELELNERTLQMLADVDVLVPRRVVVDSLSELRLLAGSSLRFRRQILALKQYFASRDCTVLLLDDMTATQHDLQMHSIAHAVIKLEQAHSDYGATRRRVRVTKYRGVAFRDGYHDYKIDRGGLKVFPRLIAAEHAPLLDQRPIASGVAALDDLLGGGIEMGTSTLIVGPPGTGKSTLAIQFAVAAARRGEASMAFLFDESVATLRTRCAGMGMDLAPFVDQGLIELRQVNPAQMSPGEFAHLIRAAVDEHRVRVVIIDSLNGYLNAMPEERFLVVHLHELLTYLGQAGLATMIVGAHQGLIGLQMQAPLDVSYLADAVLLLRFFETQAEVRQVISVVKKRGGAHERSLRSFTMSSAGIAVGEPLRNFRGILTGVPVPVEEMRPMS